jgi:putative membrane protein
MRQSLTWAFCSRIDQVTGAGPLTTPQRFHYHPEESRGDLMIVHLVGGHAHVMGGHGGGLVVGMLLWGLVGLALLVFIVVATIWLIRQMLAGSPSRRDPAEDQLRRRYASGEIDQEEYRRRIADLRER